MQDFTVHHTLHFESTNMGIPDIHAQEYVEVEQWISINYVKSFKGDKSKTGVHFFVDDYQFERCWNKPKEWVRILKDFAVVVMPDFSMFLDFPFPILLYNKFRNHWLGALWQHCGIKVYPNFMYTDDNSINWCIYGMPKGGVIAVENIGLVKDLEYRRNFINSVHRMNELLMPSKIMVFGTKVEGLPDNCEFVLFNGFSHNGEKIIKKITESIDK